MVQGLLGSAFQRGDGMFAASDNRPCNTRVPMGPRCCTIASAQLPVCVPISRARSSR